MLTLLAVALCLSIQTRLGENHLGQPKSDIAQGYPKLPSPSGTSPGGAFSRPKVTYLAFSEVAILLASYMIANS